MSLGFSWSTFFVEIVNFVILIWLLTRFLYRPVMRTLAAREQRIKDDLARAQEAQTKAAELTQRYEARLAEWEREKSKLREHFDSELATERSRREEELKGLLERERQQIETAHRLREHDEERRMWHKASQDAAGFGARLFSRLASPELEHRLIDATVEDLRALSPEGKTTLTAAFNGRGTATVTTRYAIDSAERENIEKALEACLGTRPTLSFKLDDALISGIRIELGTATVEGTLAGELRWFAEAEADVAD